MRARAHHSTSTRAERAAATLLVQVDEAHTFKLGREAHADQPRAVLARVVDDGDTRREGNPGANVSVQRAHTLLEDSLLVVHGDRDIEDGCGLAR